jgi:large subunit ribosomal protein L28
MSRKCEVCGKTAGRGNKKSERGKPKYLGGNGRKTTGISKRLYLPNLQSIRVQTPDGVKTQRVCTKCIRANRIQKAVVRQPFTIAESK